MHFFAYISYNLSFRKIKKITANNNIFYLELVDHYSLKEKITN